MKMDKKIVEFCWLIPENKRNIHLPGYETEGSAGMDVEAGVEKSVVVLPGDILLVPTGWSVAIPQGYELQVRPRSGLAVKHGITLVNSPGTIDSDYRGEVKVAIINLGKKKFTIRRGDRIAQLVLAQVSRISLREVSALDETGRGRGGFGHTGV